MYVLQEPLQHLDMIVFKTAEPPAAIREAVLCSGLVCTLLLQLQSVRWVVIPGCCMMKGHTS